jgi:hypothetical protein
MWPVTSNPQRSDVVHQPPIQRQRCTQATGQGSQTEMHVRMSLAPSLSSLPVACCVPLARCCVACCFLRKANPSRRTRQAAGERAQRGRARQQMRAVRCMTPLPFRVCPSCAVWRPLLWAARCAERPFSSRRRRNDKTLTSSVWAQKTGKLDKIFSSTQWYPLHSACSFARCASVIATNLHEERQRQGTCPIA